MFSTLLVFSHILERPLASLKFGFKPLSDFVAERRCVYTYTPVYAGHQERAPPAIIGCAYKEDLSRPYTARKQYERFHSNCHAILCGSNAVRSAFRITGQIRLERHDIPDPFAEWRCKHQLHTVSHFKLSVITAVPVRAAACCL